MNQTFTVRTRAICFSSSPNRYRMGVEQTSSAMQTRRDTGLARDADGGS